MTSSLTLRRMLMVMKVMRIMIPPPCPFDTILFIPPSFVCVLLFLSLFFMQWFHLKSLIPLQSLKYQLVMPSPSSQGCCSIIPNQNILKSIVLTIPKVCILSITIITIIANIINIIINISTTWPFQKCVPSSIRQRAPSHLLFFQLPIWSSSDWLPSSPWWQRRRKL